MHDRRPGPVVVVSCGSMFLAAAGAAIAQSMQRAAFVANNGNVEGSVTSYTFAPDGAPQFVGKFITGAGSGNAGNNAYGISLTPSGRYLAITHATAASVFERITMFRVNADATLTLVGTFQTPDSPLAAAWINDTYLAVTLTNTSAPNKVIVYRFEAAGPTLVEVDRKDSGGFTGYLAVHPSRQYLYAQDSPLGGSSSIAAFSVGPGGILTPIGAVSTSPFYALGPCISNSGAHLYGGGGISSGGNNIVGFDISALDGSLWVMPGSPFISPGSSPSPKQCVASKDDRFVFVGHGSSSEVRSFAVGAHGELSDTGFAYDVGIQGDLGGVAVLDNLLLFTRKYASTQYGPTGLMSYTIQPDGSFTPNGTVVGSQGSLPQFIAAWSPVVCYPNCDGSSVPPVLNVSDFICFQTRFAAGDSYANCDGSTTPPVLNVSDFICFQTRFAAGCS